MKALLSILGASAVACSFGSDVRGRVVLSQGRAAANAVIYLEGEERPESSGRAKVDQRDRTFIPHVSVINVGTKVEFPNHDSIFHNVFADYDAKRFDLGMYPKGASKSVTFPKAGLVVLMCSIHPEMSAYIMVVDTPYHAVTDHSGSFSIPNVKPGRYVVKVWHESGQTDSETIQVQGNVQLDIHTRRGKA